MSKFSDIKASINHSSIYDIIFGTLIICSVFFFVSFITKEFNIYLFVYYSILYIVISYWLSYGDYYHKCVKCDTKIDIYDNYCCICGTKCTKST